MIYKSCRCNETLHDENMCVMKYNNQQKQKIKTYFGNKTQKTWDRASYYMLKDIKVSCKVKQVGSLIALLPKNE